MPPELRKVSDGRGLFDRIVEHITEAGPDLNVADCVEIMRWFDAAGLTVQEALERPDEVR